MTSCICGAGILIAAGGGLTRVMGARVLARRQSGMHRFRCSGVLIVIVIVIISIIFVVASDHWNDHS